MRRPYFAIHPEDVSVYEGENVTMSCLAVGIPEPVIGWLKDNVSIDNFSSVGGNSSLALRFVEDVHGNNTHNRIFPLFSPVKLHCYFYCEISSFVHNLTHCGCKCIKKNTSSWKENGYTSVQWCVLTGPRRLGQTNSIKVQICYELLNISHTLVPGADAIGKSVFISCRQIEIKPDWTWSPCHEVA